jgi:hypothetical protein
MKTRKFKITGMKDYDFNKVKDFKAGCKSIWLSQKRQTYQKAIKEAVALHDVKEYYCEFYNEPQCKDDVFEFWYK